VLSAECHRSDVLRTQFRYATAFERDLMIPYTRHFAAFIICGG
jgi:hypothetical protein